MKEIFEALQLHTSNDESRETLMYIYVEIVGEKVNFVATDGSTLMRVTYDIIKIEKDFLNYLKTEHGYKLEKMETGLLAIDKKKRMGKLIFTPENEKTSKYPRYNHCIPTEFSNLWANYPSFPFEAMVRMNRTFKKLGKKHELGRRLGFQCTHWNTPVTAGIIKHKEFLFLCMPLRQGYAEKNPRTIYIEGDIV